MPQGIQLYVIVCTELHGAIGPFATMPAAVAAASEATQASARNGKQCVYFPVKLMFLGEVTSDHEDHPSKHEGGGYL